MRKISRAEIHPNHVPARMIDIGKRLERVRDEGQNALVLIIGESVESAVPSRLPVDAADCLRFAEWRVEVSDQWAKWPTGDHRIEQVLLRTLGVKEEEEFVFDDPTAEAAAELVPLKRIVGCAGQVCVQALVAEVVKAFTVKRIRARLCRDVNRS